MHDNPHIWLYWLGGLLYLTSNVVFFTWFLNRGKKKRVNFTEQFCATRAKSYNDFADNLEKRSLALKKAAREDKNMLNRYATFGAAADLDKQSREMRQMAKVWEEDTVS